MATCSTPADSRRRLFWATQPDACGTETECGYECGRPGLSLVSGSDCGVNCQCCAPPTVAEGCVTPAPPAKSTISTQDWLRGLVINMMMTDGRLPDAPCGYRPGAQGGHWSESYITSGPAVIGTLVRTLPAVGSIRDSVNTASAYAKATLQRLVDRGVAVRVDTEVVYLGAGKMQLNVSIVGRGNEGSTKVGLTGARLENGWVWQ